MDDQAQDRPEVPTTGEGGVRLPYERPALKVYGSVASLTQSVGKNGTVADGGAMKNMSKTS